MLPVASLARYAATFRLSIGKGTTKAAALGPDKLVSPGKSVAAGHEVPVVEQVQYKLLLVLYLSHKPY
jgi:hypothetical protein